MLLERSSRQSVTAMASNRVRATRDALRGPHARGDSAA
jgi:hypothetical protein